MKIHRIEALARLAEARRSWRDPQKVVLAHGCFDVLHIGHLRYLEQCYSLGHMLLVTITADAFVAKGPRRPVFDQDTRAEMIASLQCVDYVAINHHLSAMPAIRAIKPDFYVKGMEYQNPDDDPTGKMVQEQELVEEFGGKMVFAGETLSSSTMLLKRHGDLLPMEPDLAASAPIRLPRWPWGAQRA